ncbi:helix-turn-helix transcriptional regulator [Sphingomonadaceae bacterium jetA1]|jgi:AraC-like DNA-binding protein|uniref:helix-turn-helix transcriptional regulator n=1 Tax=Facivitalis istanbulensis TaxID=3075838 RepID=UPI0034957784
MNDSFSNGVFGQMRAQSLAHHRTNLIRIFGDLRLEAARSKVDFVQDCRGSHDGGLLLSGEGPPHIVHKAEDRSRAKRISVFMVEEGRVYMTSAGRSYHLESGQLCILDQSMPLQIEHLTPYRIRSLLVPRHYVPFFTSRQAAMVNRPIDTSSGAARILRHLASDVPSGCASDPAYSASWNVLCSTVAHVLQELLRSQADHADENWAIAKSRLFLENHYQDEDLRQEDVAKHAGISLRTLHRLLAGNGTSLAQLTQDIRLGHAKRLLLDPRCSDIPIASIAHEVGFKNAAHFSRVFREQVGETPGRWRHAAAA